ncbi:N-acetylmuramoyl-L-alanine amidase [Actinomadura luteofluorescens]|uniref:N-acetylmuramoyl-L-alanine amidase n=1 Tax=Actinomadura luteofluorescens TaxID=46163 RepID=A0A7Y9EIS7_9ACTN|nr:N-acetylmuramoyl-L-alanine amidase [Actinomadura luteofluorescens]NYD48432.1 N-acetylmuramoyl-L-alanine amidase [Actinomadura luteofluorescens]
MIAGLACLGLVACHASAAGSEPPAARSVGSAGAGRLSGKVIVIDPGHNGGNAAHPEVINKPVWVGNGRKACNTAGTATADGYAEHAFTWDVSNRLAKMLRARGAEVTLTRGGDSGVGPCVTERAAIGNRAHADAALSIHGDGAAASKHGFHVILPLPVGRNRGIVAPSARLGEAIRDAYRSGTGMPYAGYLGKDGLDRRDDLGGLNMSTVPAVFIECGNMKNAGDAARMSSAAFRQLMAESLAEGFENYLR